MKLKQNVNNKICKCECKSYHTCKNYYSLTPSTFICENSKYFSDWVWWTCNCYGHCISKKDYSNKCYEYCFNKFSLCKTKRLLYFEQNFINNHTTIGN